VVGYTRLMADDELATLETLNAYRSLISGIVRQHGGRVVDMVGDNLLAEFPSAVDSV
jgi:class 3 adenylate cyclase